MSKKKVIVKNLIITGGIATYAAVGASYGLLIYRMIRRQRIKRFDGKDYLYRDSVCISFFKLW